MKHIAMAQLNSTCFHELSSNQSQSWGMKHANDWARLIDVDNNGDADYAAWCLSKAMRVLAINELAWYPWIGVGITNASDMERLLSSSVLRSRLIGLPIYTFGDDLTF